jgi:hypothetical protein
MRAERLNDVWPLDLQFDSVLEAQTVIADWRTIYDTGGHTAVSAGELPPPSPLP